MPVQYYTVANEAYKSQESKGYSKQCYTRWKWTDKVIFLRGIF